AEVKGHSPSQRRIVTGKENVAIVGLEPVGNYAVKIVFDDGHDTGLYTWKYLYELGRDREQNWSRYLARVQALKPSWQK
ncbi:MAG TPA: gamma-butyrobetaine hydroxylase-like domain-containing protein, partial [Steroidobacteraceae bacterium]|nr:gamma-butyrobetaine hydroxylase-like domain-containing protein [Steroidobacteraceae bacterium]